MKICPLCGRTEDDLSTFCSDCGARLQDQAGSASRSTSESSYSSQNHDYGGSFEAGKRRKNEGNGWYQDPGNQNTYNRNSNSGYSGNQSSYDRNSNSGYSGNQNSYDRNSNSGYSGNQNSYDQNYVDSRVSSLIKPRSIVFAIIFSLLTFGIYWIYWMCCLNRDINYLSGEEHAAGSFMVIVLTIITFGIYGLYWIYKMGERCDRMKGNAGGSSGILYLILAIIGFNIISFALMQDSINQVVRRY